MFAAAARTSSFRSFTGAFGLDVGTCHLVGCDLVVEAWELSCCDLKALVLLQVAQVLVPFQRLQPL